MDNANELKKVTLYSYSKAWDVEKKIYSIMNLILPAPINPYTVLVYIVVLIAYMGLEKMFPFLISIPVALKYFALPFLGAQYLMKKKLDGKNPIKYLFGLITYIILDRYSYIECFKRSPSANTVLHLDWNCSKGYYKKKGDNRL